MRDPAHQVARIAVAMLVLGLGSGCPSAQSPSQANVPATHNAATNSPAPNSIPQEIAASRNFVPDAEAENLLKTLEKLSSERGIHFVTYDASHQPTAIVLPDVAATVGNLRLLGQFPTLRSISLFCAPPSITPQSFVPLSQLPMLQMLIIRSGYPELTTELASVLRSIRSLEVLEITHAPVDRQALSILAALPRLHTLTIAYTPFSDADAAVLAKFGTVEKLNLSGTGITDKSLTFIDTMPRLKWLSVSHTHVTEAGNNPLRTTRHIAIVGSID